MTMVILSTAECTSKPQLTPPSMEYSKANFCKCQLTPPSGKLSENLDQN